MSTTGKSMHILRVLVAVVLLVVMFWLVPFDRVAQAIRQAEPIELSLAAVVSLLVLVVASWRLRQLILPFDFHLSTPQVLSINLKSMFYGLILPGSNVSGAAVRFYKLYRVQPNAIGLGLALFFDRLVATIVLLALGVVFWVVDRPMESIEVFLIMAGLLAVLLLFCFSAAVFERIPARNLIEKTAGQSLFLKIRRAGEMVRRLRSISRLRLAAIFASAIVTHLLSIVTYYILARSVGVELSIVHIGWIRSAMILAKMVPISVYGLGLREGTTIYILSAYGSLPEVAAAFSLLVFVASDVFPAALGGLLELRT